jgi:hypothetical protein
MSFVEHRQLNLRMNLGARTPQSVYKSSLRVWQRATQLLVRILGQSENKHVLSLDFRLKNLA